MYKVARFVAADWDWKIPREIPLNRFAGRIKSDFGFFHSHISHLRCSIPASFLFVTRDNPNVSYAPSCNLSSIEKRECTDNSSARYEEGFLA